MGPSAGIIGGATNAMSTMLMMNLLSASDNKNNIAKVGNMYCFIRKLAQIIILCEPIMTMIQIEWQIIEVINMLSVVALLIGIRLRSHLPQGRFQKLILLILAILGIHIGWQEVTAFL